MNRRFIIINTFVLAALITLGAVFFSLTVEGMRKDPGSLLNRIERFIDKNLP